MSVEEANRNDKKRTFSVKQKFETCHKQDSDHTKNEMAAEYVCRNTVSNIERSRSLGNQPIEQVLNVSRSSKCFYKSLRRELYNWFRQCKASENKSDFEQFKAKGVDLMKVYAAPKTFEAKLRWLDRCFKDFKKLENYSIKQEVYLEKLHIPYEILESELYTLFQQRKESGNMIDFEEFKNKGLDYMNKYDAPKMQKIRWLQCRFERFEKQELSKLAKNVIQELTHRLGEENIKKYVYIMFKLQFSWNYLLTPEGVKKIDIQKLKNYLTVIFCTNITDDHKLPPFYLYDCRKQETPKDLIHMPKSCTTNNEKQKILTDWYNNHFVELVKKRQQETNVSEKVLLVSSEKMLAFHAKDIAENDNFQFITGNNLCSKEYNFKTNIKNQIRFRSKKVFQDFCTSYDINIYVTIIDKIWNNIRCEYIIKSFNDYLSDFCTEENTMATSSINQNSKLIINVTEEDTTLKEISAQVEQSKNRRSVGEYREEITSSNDIIEDLNSHKGDEEKEHQEQQDNDKNNDEITDNFTKCSNSGQKIDGRECQQLESTVSADNIINGEENIESSPLNLDEEVHVKDILGETESSDTSYDEANL